MIITIAGTAGSGKSTIAKALTKNLNAKRIYVGKIRRDLARKKGMTIEELNIYAKTHPETDVDVDKLAATKAKKLQLQGHNVIVEGRVQFHFLPNSIKLYVKADPSEAAKRIFKETKNIVAKNNRNEASYKTVKELEQQIKLRTIDDTKRFQQYYKIDDTDPSNYDFILDTTKITAKTAIGKILQFINQPKSSS
jgi:CMP/dCMP kinase